MRRVVTFILAFLVAVVAAVGLVLLLQRQFIYLPSGEVGSLPAGAAEVSFSTSDGLDLEAWFFPGNRDDGTTAVVFHGNGGNRADRLPVARALGEYGYNVLLVDYRGYGGNPGSPSEEGLHSDALAAIDYVAGRPDVDAGRLILFGESLGTGVATAAALEREAVLLILRSPFTSLPEVASGVPVLGWMSGLLWDEYPTLQRIGGVDVPVLVAAGSLDTTIPVDQSRRVYEAAGQPRLFYAVPADHNDRSLAVGFLADPDVRAFIEAAVDGPG